MPLVISCLLLNPFQNKPWFLRVCNTSLLKIMWEKEKLLLSYRVENIVGKGENASYQHFLLFLTMFSKSYFSSVDKSLPCAEKG